MVYMVLHIGILTMRIALRVSLMMVIMVSLQGNLVNSVFEYFHLDTIELTENLTENEKEGENEETDTDDFLHASFGYGYKEQLHPTSGKTNNIKTTSTERSIITPPPDCFALITS